jgi:hypothetical protein
MASRGLPGFLRRSLRVEYEEEEEEEEEKSGSSLSDVQEREESEENDGVHHQTEQPEAAPGRSTASQQTAKKPSEQRTPERITAKSDGNDSKSNSRVEDGSERSSSRLDGSIRSQQSAAESSLQDSWQEVSAPVPPDELGTSSPRKTYREQQFEKVLAHAEQVNMAELRKLAWNGIPHPYRATAWKILLGYLPTNASRREQTLRRKRAEYRDAIQQHYDIPDDTRTLQEQETLRQVLVDVPRTAPDVPLFRNDRIKRVLSRLLYIWAMRHPASSYVQGINDLTTPLLAVFLADYFEDSTAMTVLDGHVMNHLSDDRLDELEADVYWCLTNLLAGIQDHYTADQPGVQRMVMRLEELVHRIDADLTRHVRDETGIQFLQFSFKWMNCLLLREFQLPCIFRLWDTYLSEKDGFEDFHVYVCAAFLCQFSSQLQEMSFDELFAFMQDLPTSDWTDTEIEVLLSQAYVLSTLFKGSDAHLLSNAGTAGP